MLSTGSTGSKMPFEWRKHNVCSYAFQFFQDLGNLAGPAGVNEGYISATTPCFLPECTTQRFNIKTSRLTQEVKKKSSQGWRDCAWFYANCLPIQWTITYSLLLGPLCRFKSVSFVPLPLLLPLPPPPIFPSPLTQHPFMHEITEPTAVEGGWRIPVAEMPPCRSLRRSISIIFWRYLLAVLLSPLYHYSRLAILIFPLISLSLPLLKKHFKRQIRLLTGVKDWHFLRPGWLLPSH